MYKYLPYTLGRQTYVLELPIGICKLSAQRWLFAPPFAVSFPCKVNKRKCVVQENILHMPPASPRRATVIPGGGGPKEVNFQGLWAGYRVFFQGG